MITDPQVISDLTAIIDAAARSGQMISVRAEAVAIMQKHPGTHMKLAEVEAGITRLAHDRRVPIRFD